MKAMLVAAVLLAPSAALAGEQTLEFKLVTRALDAKMVQAANLNGRTVGAGMYFGVAFFKDGRVAAKDFVTESDTLNGVGKFSGYSTYTFEDGSSITASFAAESTPVKFHGDYTILSGTGLYKDATGTGSFDGLPTKWQDGAFLYDGKFNVKTP
jgi:hypothetical protein